MIKTKQFYLIVLLLFISEVLYSQKLSKTIEVKDAGSLGLILGDEIATIAELTIKGELTDNDIEVLSKMSQKNLKVLDMKDVDLKTKDKKVSMAGTLLNTIVFPIGTEIINGFDDNNYLKSVTIPDNVYEIRGFNKCSNLQTVYLGKSISLAYSSIDDWYYFACFSKCRELKEFIVSKENANFTDIEGVLYTKDRKTLVLFPNMKTEEYIVPEGTEKIFNHAFEDEYYLYGSIRTLKSITLPKTLKEIGSGAFAHCLSLKNIYSMAVSPPKMQNGQPVFDFIFDFSDRFLHVPKGSFASYWMADQWSNFSNIIEAQVSTENETVTITDVSILSSENSVFIYSEKEMQVSVYSYAGQLLNKFQGHGSHEVKLAKGFYLICINGKSYKVYI